MGFKEWRERRREKKAATRETPTTPTDARSYSQAQLTAIAGGSYSLITSPDSWLIPSVGWTDNNAERLLTASSWCCTAIMGNARAMGSLSPVVQKQEGRRWVEAEEDHPLWAFTDDPLGPDARLPFWTWAQLVEWIAIMRYLTGNAFLVPQIVRGSLYSVAPLMSADFIAQVDGLGVAREYTFDGRHKYAASAVINIMATSPVSYWKGTSPIRAALNAVDLDYYSAERQKHHMRNKVAPGMIVSFEDVMGISGPQRVALQQALIDGYQSAEDTGKPWVIGGAAKIHDPPKADALQYFDTRKFAREEMLSVIGMPPPVAGVLDNAILSNFGVATRLWWNGYLFPVLASIYSEINAQAVRKLYPGYRLWYDLTGSDVALELLAARADVAKKFVDLGYSANIAAEKAGLDMPYVPELDKPNAQLVQAGRIPLEGGKPEPEQADEEDEKAEEDKPPEKN